MQGKKIITPQLFYHQSLDEMVPEDNFYRKVNENLSLGFLYKATRSYYGSCGQDSIDPVVFFKILMVGYLNNINSDRALMRFCSNCLDVRLFLGYDINESLPFHSTISRTRALFGEELFLELFRKVLGLCVGKGMVRGKRMAVDAAFIKANASMDSLVEKEVLQDASAFVNELEENSEFKTTSTRKKLVEQHHTWKEKEYQGMPGNNKSDRKDEDGNAIRPKFLSNHTHFSPTDPDAKISVKPGKARQLNYSGQLSVDDAHHVILGACASSSGSKDSVIFPDIMNQTIENCKQTKLPIDEVLADAGYNTAKRKASTPTFPTSVSTNHLGKALFLIKKITGMSAQNLAATRLFFLTRVRKQIPKATQRKSTEAAREIAKIVHFAQNVVAK